MVRTVRRARLLWRALACATFVFLLAGCGGGGGSTPPADGGGAGTPPTESTYLLAEFVASDSNNQYVRVWDPASPSTAVQNVRLVMGNGIIWTSSHLLFSNATTYDAGTRTVTTAGHSKVFFDNDGKLYSIDLRGGHSHAPVQLSSAADVFLVSSVTPMNAAGDDAWIDVQGGNSHWAIRSTMGATDAPVKIQQIVAPLRDAGTGLPAWFFVSQGGLNGTHVMPTTFEIVDAAFTPMAIPAVAGMTTGDGWVGADPAQSGLGYLRIASQMRELHWGAGALVVDTLDLHPSGVFARIASVADAQSLYFNDGFALYAVANGSVRPVGSFSLPPSALVDAGGYVAAAELSSVSASQVSYQVETLRKSDGALTLVEAPTTTLQLLAASDQGLVLAGTAEQGQAFVLASGDNVTRTTLGKQFVGVVRAAGARVDQPAAPVALLACEAGTTGFCLPGPLTQLTLSGAPTVLGTLAAATASVRGDAIAGLAVSVSGQTLLSSPGGFGSNETDRRDAWQFTPGSAGSLTRATAYLP